MDISHTSNHQMRGNIEKPRDREDRRQVQSQRSSLKLIILTDLCQKLIILNTNHHLMTLKTLRIDIDKQSSQNKKLRLFQIQNKFQDPDYEQYFIQIISMSIFDVSKAMMKNNFSEAAKMIEINNLQAQLVSTAVQTEIQKNKLNYRYPASVSIAKVHTQASKFGFSPSNQGQRPRVCPCCFNRVENEPIQICYSTTHINQEQEIGYEEFKLSSSVSLYFSFIKMIILYFLIRFLICDGFNLVSNYLFGGYCDKNEKCEPAPWNYISTLNIKQQNQYLFIQDILNLVIIVLSIIFFFFYRKSQYNFHKEIDKNQQTENDYTLFISGIPLLDFPSADETKKMKKGENMELYHRIHLWDFFQEKIRTWIQMQENWKLKQGTNEYDLHELKQKNNGQLRSDQIVKSISLCYNLSRLEILDDNRTRIMQKQHQYLQKEEEGFEMDDYEKNRFSTLPERVNFLNDCQIVLNKQFANDNSILFTLTHFVGSAFVSFQYQHYRQHILQSVQQDQDYLKFNGENLKAEKASYPSDVYWKNLKYSDAQRTRSYIFSGVVLLMALVFAFGILVTIQGFKMGYQKRAPEDPTFLQNLKVYGLVFLAVIATMLINKALSWLIYQLTQKQRHTTRSTEVMSLVVKMVIAHFLNTAILYYVISRVLRDSLTSKVGLVLQITSLIVVSGIINILYELVRPKSIVRSLNLFCKYRNLSEEDTVDKFQKQLNNQFKYVEFDMATHYAFYMLMSLTVSFYCYLVPVIVPAIVIIFALQYWVDKINLFKRSSLKYNFNFSLSRFILKSFESSIMIFGVGWGLFSIYIKGELNIFNFIGFGISFAYFLFLVFGTQRLEKRIFGKYESSQVYLYDDCVGDGKFHETYWTKNPATYLIKEQDVTGRNHILNPVLNKIFVTSRQNNQ